MRNPDESQLDKWINEIALFPSELDAISKQLSVVQLNWNYRPDGWTIKQVIHHCADSHMNSLIRFKLTLTENTPIIRPYFEDKWANLNDSQDDDISVSIALLRALHKKWVLLLKGLTKEQLLLEYIHPAQGQKFNLAETIGQYAWHCKHHLGHVQNAISSKGEFKD